MHYKLIEQAEIKINNDGPGSISGYGSTFEPWDRVNEKPIKGAFLPFLPALKRDGFMAIGHDWRLLPVASFKEVGEDDHGLYFDAEFHSTTMAQEARIVINERRARGKSVPTSIGYDDPTTEVVNAPELKGGRGTLLKLVPVHEISIVTVPANPQALIYSAKDWLPAGLSMDDQRDAALTAVRGYLDRVKSLRELRAKQGRRLSAATELQLKTVLATIQELLGLELEEPDEPDEEQAADEPQAIDASAITMINNAETLKQFALYQRGIALANGVIFT